MKALAFLLAFLIAGAVSARTVLNVPVDPDARVHLRVESGFTPLPSSGYMPVDVTINNSSGRTQTWNLQFSSPAQLYFSFAQVSELVNFNTSVTVESGATRTFRFLAPLSTCDQGTAPGETTTLGVRVSGYGFPDATQQLFPSAPRAGKTLTPCMAVTEGAAARVEARLENAASAAAQQLQEVKCQADELPDDWRALSGFTGIWLLDSEWSALTAPQRNAVEDWVATGGTLFLCAKAPLAPPRRLGIGAIVSVDLRRSLNPMQTLLRGVDAGDVQTNQPEDATSADWGKLTRGDINDVVSDDLARWNSANQMGVLKPNVSLLISFLVVFATVVAPLNLFVFAREGRRSRLFWTVPLISLGATLLLFVVIIVQDGFGGSGMRSALICLVPSARKEVVFQEQISRTGVLGSSAFSLRDPAWMTMVNLASGAASRRNARSVRTADVHFAGEWFKSRSLQAQWIESVIPTRAEVTLINPREARESGSAPVIVSSIAAPLSDLWFWDSSGKCWRAANVRTGVKTVLSPGAAPKDLLADARVPLRRRLSSAEAVPGNFVAVCADAASFIATLPSIRWKNRQAIYVGPVTSGETSK